MYTPQIMDYLLIQIVNANFLLKHIFMSVFRYVYEIFMYYLRLFRYVNTSDHEIEKKTTTVNGTENTNSIPLLQLI